MKAVPTLLTTSKHEFIVQIERFQHYFDRIQLDIADGKLVPNKTTQIQDMIELITSDSIPIRPQVTFDFHLMVSDFEPEIKKIRSLQSQGLNVNAILVNAEKKPNIAELKRTYQFSIGLDIFPSTEIKAIACDYNLSKIPQIQIMTVNPGFQGSPFLSHMLQKIEQLRTHYYTGEILIDGGVNSKTLPEIMKQKYQPDIVCIGSFLTKAGTNLGSRIKELKNLERS